MSESIRLGEQVGAIIANLKEIARHTKCTSCNTGSGATGPGAPVTISNTSDNPVPVFITSSVPVTTSATSAGVAGPIPAGFKSISIVKTSANTDTITLTLSDASTYDMTERGEVFADASTDGELLPAYAISGSGTFKWHGIK